MPSISGKHDRRKVLTMVSIIDAASYADHKRQANPFITGLRPFVALIDTGATTTMITTRVVEAIGATPIGRTLYRGISGEASTKLYMFNLAFFDGFVQVDDPLSDQGHLMDRLQVCNKVIRGGEIRSMPSFDVLIGMDIITTGTLTVRSEGTFTFDF